MKRKTPCAPVYRRPVAALWLLFSAALLAQTPGAPFTVFGRVSLPDGTPASRVRVRLERPGGAVRQVVTDDSGRYEIPDLPRGRYFVTAENPADSSQYTDPVEAEAGRAPTTRVQANIYLRYRSEIQEARASRAGAVTLLEESMRIPKAARKSFDEAIRQRNEKHYEKALQSFNQSITLFPGYFQAFAERGHLRIAMGNVDGAVEDFRQALEMNPGYAPALRGAGICAFQQGRFAESARDLEKAADAEPGNAMTYLFWGVSSLALDQREQARGSLARALTIDPKGAARAHVYLANLAIKESRLQEAVAHIEKYLSTVPDAPDAGKLRDWVTQLRAQLPPAGKPQQ